MTISLAILIMKFDLEERLIAYAVSVLETIDQLPPIKGAKHLGSQLVRSGTAPALMFGEAIGAESRKDFIHKMKLALKELRETSICLRIIETRHLGNQDTVPALLRENIELISIFVKSIKTASSK